MDNVRDDLPFGNGGGDGAGARLHDVESFGSNPGNLRLRLLPASGPSRPMVVALHGCTQTAAGFAEGSGWRRLAEANDFALLLPEQRAANNRKTCFSWFEPRDTRRGEGEVESIRQMIEHVVGTQAVDAQRIFATGLSAGGSMAGALLATCPELFAGGAIVAGLPYGAADSAAEAFDCMFVGRTREPRYWGDAVRIAAPSPARWPTVAIWQGTADTVVKPINAGELVKQWTNVHGVAAQVPLEDDVGTTTRRVWRDEAKRPCVIEYSVPGLGHGMPVDAESPPAPFFLPAGIDAAEQIAGDFGILRARRTRRLLCRLGLAG